MSDPVSKSNPSALPESLDALRAEVCRILEIPVTDVADDDNLLDCGLDSIRLMTLAERWQRSGADIPFVTLAEQPTLEQWWQLLNPLTGR